MANQSRMEIERVAGELFQQLKTENVGEADANAVTEEGLFHVILERLYRSASPLAPPPWTVRQAAGGSARQRGPKPSGHGDAIDRRKPREERNRGKRGHNMKETLLALGPTMVIFILGYLLGDFIRMMSRRSLPEAAIIHLAKLTDRLGGAALRVVNLAPAM